MRIVNITDDMLKKGCEYICENRPESCVLCSKNGYYMDMFKDCLGNIHFALSWIECDGVIPLFDISTEISIDEFFKRDFFKNNQTELNHISDELNDCIKSIKNKDHDYPFDKIIFDMEDENMKSITITDKILRESYKNSKMHGLSKFILYSVDEGLHRYDVSMHKDNDNLLQFSLTDTYREVNNASINQYMPFPTNIPYDELGKPDFIQKYRTEMIKVMNEINQHIKDVKKAGYLFPFEKVIFAKRVGKGNDVTTKEIDSMNNTTLDKLIVDEFVMDKVNTAFQQHGISYELYDKIVNSVHWEVRLGKNDIYFYVVVKAYEITNDTRDLILYNTVKQEYTEDNNVANIINELGVKLKRFMDVVDDNNYCTFKSLFPFTTLEYKEIDKNIRIVINQEDLKDFFNTDIREDQDMLIFYHDVEEGKKLMFVKYRPKDSEQLSFSMNFVTERDGFQDVKTLCYFSHYNRSYVTLYSYLKDHYKSMYIQDDYKHKDICVWFK